MEKSTSFAEGAWVRLASRLFPPLPRRPEVIQGHMAQHSVPVDVDSLIGALNLWKTQGDPLGSVWRDESENIARHNFNDVTLSTISTLPRRSKELLNAVEAIVETLDTLRAILTPDLNTARSSFESVTRMCGLAMLPDELLAEILTYAVVDESGVVDVEKSLLLSRVSKRFRRLALTTGDLWTNIMFTARPGSFVTACISRSGDRLVDITAAVHFSNQSSVQHFLEFFTRISSVADRWQSFKLELNQGAYDLRDDAFPNLSGMLSKLARLYLPKLRSIDINLKFCTSEQDYYVMSSQDMARISSPFFGATWTVPDLRAVCLHNFVPHGQSLPFSSIKSMEIHLTAAPWRIGQLVECLVACTSLTDLVVALDKPRLLEGAPATKSLLPVRKLNLNLLYEGGIRNVRVFMNAVGFPECRDLSICIMGRPETESECDMFDVDSDGEWDVLDLSSYGRTIFSPVRSFPKVEVLRVDIKTDDFVNVNNTTLVVPLENIPSLKHLVLSSNLTLYLDPDFHDVHLRYPALQTVVLETGYKRLKEWAGWLAAKLESQGDWETFKPLRVRDRNNAKTSWIYKTIPKETMRSWFKWRALGTSPQSAIDLTDDT